MAEDAQFNRDSNLPGFQGSETSSVEVTFYRQRGDLIGTLFGHSGDGTPLQLRGTKPQDQEHSIISLGTQKMLSSDAGTWNVTLKPSYQAEDLFRTLVDDDWVDISINRWGTKWHVMRGLVDDVRRSRRVSGSGATSVSYTISGRDFTKVLEQTALFQDIFALSPQSAAAFAPNTLFNTLRDSAVSGVGNFVEQSLRGFLQTDNDDQGRTGWKLPLNMPGRQEYFIDMLRFWTNGYLNDPPRILFSNHWVSVDGMLWPWIIERSDPAMTDVWTDTLPNDVETVGLNATSLQSGLSPKDSAIYVIVRDKPFPRTDTSRDGPWFKNLATFIVPRQQIAMDDVGKTGMERFNAFFMAPLVFGHSQKSHDPLTTMAPEWYTADVDRHGLRRWDLQTIWGPNYTANGARDWQGFQDQYRQYLRDWHCLNPYLLNGSFSLGVGRPDIRVGHKLRIPGDRGETDQETYYIEGVSHDWQYGPGTRTTLNVTRGWIGTDDQLLSALQSVADAFTDPKTIRAVPESGVA